MARNVFISFRYSDGHNYKNELAELFDSNDDTVDFSEDEDRSQMSETFIQQFLYRKLKRSSVTIVLLTPQAVEYKTNIRFNTTTNTIEWFYDDWIYDEVRYSLEDREGNATNGIVAVYVPEVEDMLFHRTIHKCPMCNKESEVLSIYSFNNLIRKNMMNVKNGYKINPCEGIYDSDFDSYCSLVSYEKFKNNFNKYIDMAFQKRDDLYKYTLCKRIEP